MRGLIQSTFFDSASFLSFVSSFDTAGYNVFLKIHADIPGLLTPFSIFPQLYKICLKCNMVRESSTKTLLDFHQSRYCSFQFPWNSRRKKQHRRTPSKNSTNCTLNLFISSSVSLMFFDWTDARMFSLIGQKNLLNGWR